MKGNASRLGFGAQRMRAHGATAFRSMRPVAAAALLACFALSCQEADGVAARRTGPGPSRCLAEPVGSVAAFVDDAGESTTVGFSAVVVARLAADDLGLERVVVREATGRERRIAFRAPGDSLPVRVGGRYGFAVEHEGEAPRCAAILVWDARGLLYAAASDVRPGAVVLRDGVPGFALALEPRQCPSRPHGECFDAIYNTALRVTLGKERIALHHGETAPLGAYRVRCLTAQEVIYGPRCADAALFGVAYTIRREK